MKKITSKNYKKDKYYSIVCKAVHDILQKKNYVCPVDLFIQCGRLEEKKYQDWRLNKFPYLEKILNGNLSVLNRFLQILKFHAKSMGLKESGTVYKSFGKGPKNFLRFSKSGNSYMEKLYSTHYVNQYVNKNK